MFHRVFIPGLGLGLGLDTVDQAGQGQDFARQTWVRVRNGGLRLGSDTVDQVRVRHGGMGLKLDTMDQARVRHGGLGQGQTQWTRLGLDTVGQVRPRHDEMGLGLDTVDKARVGHGEMGLKLDASVYLGLDTVDQVRVRHVGLGQGQTRWARLGIDTVEWGWSQTRWTRLGLDTVNWGWGQTWWTKGTVEHRHVSKRVRQVVAPSPFVQLMTQTKAEHEGSTELMLRQPGASWVSRAGGVFYEVRVITSCDSVIDGQSNAPFWITINQSSEA